MAFSLLILMVFFPLILGLSEPGYHRASGLTTQPYLWRWLGVTGVLFAGSAVSYALRWRQASSRARKQAPRARPQQAAPVAPGEVRQPPAAHDPVPSPAAPQPGFDVWNPARPAHGPNSPGPQ